MSMNEIWTTQDQYYTYIKKIADNIFKDSNIIYEILIIGIYNEKNKYNAIVYSDNENNKYSIRISNILNRRNKTKFRRYRRKMSSDNEYKRVIYNIVNDDGKYFAYISEMKNIIGIDVFIVFNNDKMSSSNYHKFVDYVDDFNDNNNIDEIRSFLDAIVYSYLRNCLLLIDELFIKNKIIYNKSDINLMSNKILIESGNNLMNHVIGIIGVNNENDTFDMINSISQMSYENTYINGSVVLIKNDYLEYVSPIFRLKDYTNYKMDKSKTTRKLIQMARNDILLASDSEFIYGLYHRNGIQYFRDVFIVKIIGQSKWELYNNQWLIMYVEYGIPKIMTGIDKNRIRNRVKENFKQKYIEDINNFIFEVINITIKERKGITLIFSDNAINEVDEPSIVCIKIQVTSIRYILESMYSLINIDGGILMDREGNCYAIGVILQHEPKEQGNPSRGSRYHAANTYYNNNKDSAFVVVISEDGYIDFFPEPKK